MIARRQLLHGSAVVGLVAAVSLLTSSCRDRPEGSESPGSPLGRGTGAPGNDTLLLWRFVAAASDSAVVRGALRDTSGVHPKLDSDFVPPAVWLLNAPGQRRYILFAEVTGTDSGRAVGGPGLFLISPARGGGSLSRPFMFGDAEATTVEAVVDVDGDGADDVIVCERFEGEGESQARVLSFVNDEWLELRDRGGRPCTT